MNTKKWNIDPNFRAPDPAKTLGDLIDENLAKFKHRTAFIYLDRKFSYQDVDIYSKKLAIFLQHLGLQAGSRIAVMLPNIIQYPIATFAIIRAGYILVNVNPMYTQRELFHQLKDSGAEALFILQDTLMQFNDLEQCPALKYIITTHALDWLKPAAKTKTDYTDRYPKQQFFDFKSLLEQASDSDFIQPNQQQQDSIILQYTGGTAGV